MISIIRITFIEMLKKKIIYLTLAMTFAFLLLYGTGLHFTYKSLAGQQATAKILMSGELVSFGIYASSFIIAFLSVFSSVGAISSNIEDGTFLAILSKPIHRYEVLLGRWIGILMLLLTYSTILFTAIVSMGQGLGIHISQEAYLKSLFTFYLLPAFLVSLGICLSTFISTIGAGVTLVILYFCAMVAGMIEQIGHFLRDKHAGDILSNIGILTSLVMPSDILYRKSSSLLFTTSSGLPLTAQGIGANVQPSNLMLIYIGIYIVILLLLSVRKFHKRDI